MRNRLSIPSLAILLATLALLLGAVAPALALEEEPGKNVRDRGGLAIHHGPVEVTLVNEGSDGHQLGDLRVTSTLTTTTDGEPLGRLDATLTTTAIDVPGPSDEIRISTLVFSFGDDGSTQATIGGSAIYPGEGSTIAIGDTTTRPILGGTGRLAGATGVAVTTHLDDGSWVHTLKIDRKGRAQGLLQRAFRAHAKAELGDLRVAQRERREERQESRAERKVENDAEKAERKADKEARKAAKDATIDVDTGETTNAAPEEVGITRTDLGVAEPGSAPGEELGLWHYSIPAGSELAPHTHPGWQVARIASGVLEYNIIAGEATIISEDGSSRQVGPGAYTLETGDTVVENPDLEHFGANRTDDVVTIIAATLYPQGAPLSTPLDSVAAA